MVTAQAEKAELKGLAEAERQIRVATRLYAASGAEKPWATLNLEGQRPWIDRACQPEHVDRLG